MSKSLKKAYILFLTVMLILSVSSFPVLAADIEAIKSTDSNILAIDENFLDSAQIDIQNGMLILSKEYQVEKAGVQAVTNAEVDSFVKEIVYLLPDEETTAENLYNELRGNAAILSAGSKTETGVDNSISIRGTLTITYDRIIINGSNFIKLTGVSGGYTTLDSQVKVKSQLIACGCTGLGVGQFYEQSDYFTKSTASWSYTPPSNWAYVCSDIPEHFVGANCTYTLQRIGSAYTWDFVVSNNT